MWRHRPRILFLILGLSLIIKLSLFLLIANYHPTGIFEDDDPDAFEYQQLALNLLNHGEFSRSVGAPFEVETIRTPGYPLFLSGIYTVFGVYPWAAILFQIAVSLVTIFMAFKIAALLFNEKAGVLTAGLLALDPVSTYYSQVILSETLFACCLTGSLFLFLNAMRAESGSAGYVWGSFLLALATYTRPTSYYLGLLIPVVLGFYWLFARDWKRALTVSLLVFLVQVICVGGWQVRNYFHTGSAEFSQVRGEYLLYASAAGLVAMKDGISLREAQDQLADQHSRSLSPEIKAGSRAQLSESRGRFAVEVIKQHPALFLWATLKNGTVLLIGPSNLSRLFGLSNAGLRESFLRFDFTGHAPVVWLAVLSLWAYGMGFLLVLYAGSFMLLVRRGLWNFNVLFLLLIVAYVVVVSSGPESYSRFRTPIIPVLCILSAGGYRSASGARGGARTAHTDDRERRS